MEQHFMELYHYTILPLSLRIHNFRQFRRMTTTNSPAQKSKIISKKDNRKHQTTYADNNIFLRYTVWINFL